MTYAPDERRVPIVNEMIKRVAAALYLRQTKFIRALFGGHPDSVLSDLHPNAQEVYFEQARTAIEVMREPIPKDVYVYCRSKCYAPDAEDMLSEAWRALIDEALKTP